MAKILRRARDEARFVPWESVFADASVTGRTPLRRGYLLCKEGVRKAGDALDTLYVDDLGRAARNAIESYRLARLMEQLGKRMIGASDGFDLHAAGAEVHLMALAMFNEMFVRQLREKVLRGMRGATERGTSIGKPRFGYRLVTKLDRHGNPVMNPGKEKPVRELQIDPEEMRYVI